MPLRSSLNISKISKKKNTDVKLKVPQYKTFTLILKCLCCLVTTWFIKNNSSISIIFRELHIWVCFFDYYLDTNSFLKAYAAASVIYKFKGKKMYQTQAKHVL